MTGHAHLTAYAIGTTALKPSAPITITLGSVSDDVVSGAVLHEERHRQLLLSTPFGLGQFYLSLALLDGTPTASLRECSPLSQTADKLMKISLLTHEGWALAAEAFELPLHGRASPAHPIGSDREALELYSVLAKAIPASWEACTMRLLRAAADVCLQSTLTAQDLTDGLTSSTIHRWLADSSEHPDERLLYLVTEWERSGPPASLERSLADALREAFPNDERDHSSIMQDMIGLHTGAKRDPALQEAVDAAFSWRLEEVVKETIRQIAPSVQDRDPQRTNAFAAATAIALSAQGVAAEPVTTIGTRIGDLSWNQILANYSIHYSAPAPVRAVYLNYEEKFGDATSEHFAGVLRLFEGLTWIAWASVDFLCLIGFEQGDFDGKDDIDILKHWTLSQAIAENAGRGLYPACRIFVPPFVRVDLLVESLGDLCIGVVTVDELEDEGRDWSLGGHLSTILSTRVGVLVRAKDYRASAAMLEMYRKRGTFPIRQVLRSEQRHYYATHYFGVQIVFELPSALPGLVAAYNPELQSWFQESLELGRASYASGDVAAEWESNLAVMLLSGVLHRPEQDDLMPAESPSHDT